MDRTQREVTFGQGDWGIFIPKPVNFRPFGVTARPQRVPRLWVMGRVPPLRGWEVLVWH
jgi:hypothetical protein